jgi:hypothetical protein
MELAGTFRDVNPVWVSGLPNAVTSMAPRTAAPTSGPLILQRTGHAAARLVQMDRFAPPWQRNLNFKASLERHAPIVLAYWGDKRTRGLSP